MKTLLILVICAYSLTSCDSDSAGSDTRLGGDISGVVVLNNAAGLTEEDLSGAQVLIEGTAYSTLSDEEGQWTLKNIPAGKYTFVFTKEGYGPLKVNEIVFEEAANHSWPTVSVTLRKIPTFVSAYELRPTIFGPALGKVSYDSTFVDATGYEHRVEVTRTVMLEHEKALFELAVRTPPNVTGYEIVGFILYGKDENVDINDPGSYQAWGGSSHAGAVSDAVIKVAITRSKLLESGFKSGDRIFCVGYGSTMNSTNSYYYDMILKNYVFTGYSPNRTSVERFILP